MKSNLTDVTILSPHYSSRSGRAIDRITIHHMAGHLSAEACGKVFQTRQASSNYGIGPDGRVGCYVPEEYRAWSTANYANDARAINIELANDSVGGEWHVSDATINKCIELCVDICKRYGFRLNYDGTPNGSLTRHNMFINTTCPGPYLESKFAYIAEEVNRRLDAPATPTVKSIDEIAQEVINGKWGNGSDRKTRLANAGYNVDAVQSKVNELLGVKKPTRKSDEEIAREVIAGKWGNGRQRKALLATFGYDYNRIQNLVNKILRG